MVIHEHHIGMRALTGERGDAQFRTLRMITFPNASRFFDVTRNAVHFWGHDQSMETSFFIGADTLRRLNPTAADEAGLLDTFDRNRPRICAAASKLYGNGRKGGSYDLQPSDF